MARGYLNGVVWGVLASAVIIGGISVATGPVFNPPANQTGEPDADVTGNTSDVPDPSVEPDAESDTPDATSEDTGDTQIADTPDSGAEPASAPTAPESKPDPAPAQDDLPKAEPESAPKPAPDPAVEAPAPQVDPARPGRRPVPETGFETPQAPGGAIDAPEGPFEVGADTDLPELPEISDAPDAPAGAEPSEAPEQVAPATDAPVGGADQADAPGAPELEGALVISTEPAQPPQPLVSQEETALVDDDTSEPVEPDTGDASEAEPEPAVAPAADPVSESPQSAGAQADESGQPEQGGSPADDTSADAAPETPVALEPQPAPQPVPQPEPEPAPVEQTAQDGDRPRIGKPAGSLLDRESAVPTSRLPRVGDAAAQPGAGQARQTPLDLYAAKADPAPQEGAPRLSIILIDDKVDTWGPQALKALPIPVSIAIPPSHPEAAQTAREYRALGFEVLAMAAMPEGAQPSDVEVVLGATLDAVPEAIAVLEDPANGIQANRAVADQATAYLAASGHGLVMLPKGLNTAQQLASKAGVPSASLFRDMDRDGSDAATVRRTLEQAAFRSKQDGSAVTLGRLHADTLTGLIQWGLQDKNASIAIVPVSTILKEAMPQ